jgi:hypothetical protein
MLVSQWLFYRIVYKSSRYPFARTRLRRMRQTLDSGISNSRLLTKVSRTRSIVSADFRGRPFRFTAHRRPLCWDFLYHSRIVLSVGGSVWYFVRNFRYTVTIGSVFGKFQDAELLLIPCACHVSSRLPLAVKPASTQTNMERFSTY